ncbi:MAG TPA: hypothetical protein VLA68_07400 [Nitrososphaera sp.]|nr:hypothetical protein [Nitrososphaera sp.]
MRLGRGHILLITGGATVIVSLSLLGYYGMRFITNVEAEEKYQVDPNGSIEVQENITNTNQGAYVVAFPDFTGGRPIVTISDPSGQVIVDKALDPPIVIEQFPADKVGNYTLTLSNPSPDQVLEASVLLGTPESVLSRADISSAFMTLAFGILLVAGAGAIIAGVVILILDKRRMSKMKQYGDTTDLV